MSDEKNIPNTPEEEPKEPVVYASPMKRIWAWVGVVYMLIITFLVVYMLSFGTYLKGIGGIMICPALGGVAASLVYMWRSGDTQNTMRRVLLCLLVGMCGALIIMGLWSGIPALIANFGVR